MGGFYGSVQVKTEDRIAVVRAVFGLGRQTNIRCLVGPLLDGWVGVYPEGAGQDQNYSQALAKILKGDVLHAAVHDDSLMAYWLYRDGELIDTYWSAPGIFSEAERAAQEQAAGNPAAFVDLIGPRAEKLSQILNRDREDLPFEASRLQEFARLLGIANGVTSYEYLRAGEIIGIDAWEEFEAVPPEAPAPDAPIIRQRQTPLDAKREQYLAGGQLLSDAVEDRLAPRACAIRDGLLVAWEGYGRGEPRLDLYRHPYDEPEQAEIETGGNVNSICANSSGDRIAMGLGHRVVVWDTSSWNPVIEMVEDNWAVETALSADGALLAWQSRKGVYVHQIDSGKRVTALSAHDGPALAFDPTGQWLISGGRALWIARVRDSSPWKELYPGGQAPASPDLSWAMQQQMKQLDLNAIENKYRAAIEAAMARMAAAGQSFAASEQLVAKMKEQMDRQLEQMRRKFDELKAGKVAAPREGNESVLCAGVTRDERFLWLGCDAGLRIYDWEAVIQAAPDSPMPAPLMSYPRGSLGNGSAEPHQIYAAVELLDRPALLFGGYSGELCELDLNTNTVRQLMSPPDGGAIVGICPSLDGVAIGLSTRLALGAGAAAPDERSIWQIWSYQHIASAK